MDAPSKSAAAIDISVIIVNWNTAHLLKNCLGSVYQTMRHLSFEVIVVDNASTDDSLAMLRQDYPDVIIISNEANRGFGAANNQALAIMRGEYALLINSDAVLTAGAVEKLWSFIRLQPRAAIVCGQLLNADGSKQNSIAAFPTLLTLLMNNSLLEYILPGYFPSKRYEHKAPLEADSAIGACMMIRKKAVDEAGFFDERYFFFFEETDLAYALRQQGWKIYQVPDAFIYHLQGQSVGHNLNSRLEFYCSRDQFFRKWHGNSYYYLTVLIIFVRLLINWLFNFLANILTLGTVKKLRQKLAVYSGLIIRYRKDRKIDNVSR